MFPRPTWTADLTFALGNRQTAATSNSSASHTAAEQAMEDEMACWIPTYVASADSKSICSSRCTMRERAKSKGVPRT